MDTKKIVWYALIANFCNWMPPYRGGILYSVAILVQENTYRLTPLPTPHMPPGHQASPGGGGLLYPSLCPNF